MGPQPQKAKKRSAEDSSTPSSKKLKSTTSNATPIPFKSSLISEEVDFVRGGGSSLAPLQYKEAINEARKEADADALFEDAKEKKAKQKSKAFKDGKKPTKGKSSSAVAAKSHIDTDQFRVEHLNYKRLAVGTPLFGRIDSIHPLHLVVSLPSQLVGHVPITQVSSQLTTQLNQMQTDSDDENELEEQDDIPQLADLFTVGSYIRCSVTQVFDPRSSPPGLEGWHARTETEKACKRVELTIIPSVVNAGVQSVDLENGFTISGTISSVEDYGYSVDLGLTGGVTGYLDFKDVAEADRRSGDGKYLKVGQPLTATVSAVSENKRLLTLTLSQSILASSSLTAVSNITSLLPGTLVSALVTAVIPKSGLNLKILGFFDGSVDLTHCGPSDDLEVTYKIGRKIKARIIYLTTTIDAQPRFGLSLLPHIVGLTDQTPPAGSEMSMEDYNSIGTIFDNVKVVSVNPDWGLTVDVDDGIQGYVHISQVSDDHIPTLSSTQGKYAVNTTHKARVIGHSLFDGLLHLSLKPSILNQKFMSVSSLAVGEILKGTIKKLTPKGLFVNLEGSTDGVVWPLHYADIKLKNPERRFKIGGSVKCRVLLVDAEKNRVALTLKKTLIESDLPILSEVTQEDVGTITHAVISKLVDKGLIIDLFGRSRAFVALKECAEGFTGGLKELEKSFSVGKVVRVKIIYFDNETQKITASIRQGVPGASAPTTTKIAAGSSSTASAENGSNDNATKDGKKPRKQKKDKSSEVTMADLEVGMSVNGTVKRITDVGVFVRLSDTLTARVMITNLFDEFVKDWKPKFEPGQKVTGKIVSFNEKKNQVELTFRTKDAPVAKAKVLGYGNFSQGQKVDATVKRVETFGVFLKINDSNVSGLCHKSELSDENDGDVGKALKGFREGDSVKAIILTIDPEARKISFGIKPSYFSASDLGINDEDDEDIEFGDSDEGAEDDEEDDDVDEVMEESHHLSGFPSNIEGEEDHDSEVDEDDEDDEEVLEWHAPEEEVEDEEDDEDAVMVADDNEEISTASSSRVVKKGPAPTLALAGGFDWLGNTPAGAGQSSDESDSEDEHPQQRTTLSMKKKAIQHDFTADIQTRIPESAIDFERLLISGPNDSRLWIQYMSFHLQISETDKAREIGRRALKAISFREEEAKLNIWVALLNLENAFGSEESFEALFKEAVQFNDPKAVHLLAAGMFESSDKFDQAEEVFKKALKKFGQSSKVWTTFGEYYLKRNNLEAARELLPRSLKSLPKRKHVKTISKFAQLEFKLGEPERGKTIFEGIIESYPKRLDLWSIYIDLENRPGNIQGVRNLFERCLARKQSVKKAKFLFKKWLIIERAAIGGDEGMVRQRAVAFVQGNSPNNDEDEEEEEVDDDE